MFNRKRTIERKAEDFVILIHQFGYLHVGEQPHVTELYKFLFDRGYSKDDVLLRGEIDQIIRDCFVESSNSSLIYRSEAYYRYLEYIELVEVRKNNETATRNSWVAIGIASVLALIQIWIELNR